MKNSRYVFLTSRTPSEIKKNIAYYQNTLKKLEKSGADFDTLYGIKETIEELKDDLRFAYAEEENEQD